MTVHPPVRVTPTHLLWEMRPDGVEADGEAIWACQTLCATDHSLSRFLDSEAPRLDERGELAPVACWGCREQARNFADVAPLVSLPAEPGRPLDARPPRHITAETTGDRL
jgi:hypothetical protein